ncbi:MAG: hypothetical protein JW839_16330 [Candidatus Lokiarchaeota archaeon]|nr:hypothetical protein [Candidatus Lokiarchaeota archaeon]
MLKSEFEAIGKELVRRGLARKDMPVDQGLIDVARSVIEGYDGGKVHDRVVQKALQECDGVAAVEVPVWARDKSMVGHVDIVCADKDENGFARITVADFKTEDEVKFPRFVPQVEAYARMLESQLSSTADVHVECVLFNKDAAWRWEPGALDRLATTDPVLKQMLDNEIKKRKVKS